MRASQCATAGIVPALSLALLPLAWGCATGSPQTSQALDEFQSAYQNMAGQFGDGKADLLGGIFDPCPLLTKIAPFGHDLVRTGFDIGVSGEGVLGVTGRFGGYDLVWDLYHGEFTVSRFSGRSASLPAAGAAVQAFVGEAFGFENGVSDWDGYFADADVDIGLPFLKDYLSVDPAVFATGVDDNQDGVIEPDEVLAPPNGVYGFSIAAELGFNLLPNPLPVGASVSEGLWQPYKAAIRHFYDEFKSTRMFWVRKMHVRLVDADTGETCPDDWPNVDGDRDCVIKFGYANESYVSRAVNTAYAICHVTGRCAVPISWPLSGEALAIGALRQSGLSMDQLCPAN